MIAADIQGRQQSGRLPATSVKGRLPEHDLPLPQLCRLF
jgi:hypothetical protein